MRRLLVLFFFSGCAALIYETVWFYLVQLVVGASSISVAVLLCAFMGDKDKAIAEGTRAVELKPERVDAVDGPAMNCYLALIYTRVGEREQALALIERQLKRPSASDSVHYSVSLQDLRHRWEWDPVRDDPRFQQFIAGP